MPTNPPPINPRNPPDPLHQENRDAEDAQETAVPDNAGKLYLLRKSKAAVGDSVVDDTAILAVFPLSVHDEAVPILVPPYAISLYNDDTLSLFSSSDESQSPPGSTHTSPPKLISFADPTLSKAKMAAFAPSAASGPGAPLVSFTQKLPPNFSSGVTPADMIAHLSSPDCTLSHDEKISVYKAILKTSVLAYDAETGHLRFSWVHATISSLEGNAKAAALLQGDITAASLCNTFLAQLEASKNLVELSTVMSMFKNEGGKGEEMLGFLRDMMTKERENQMEERLRKELGIEKSKKAAKQKKPPSNNQSAPTDESANNLPANVAAKIKQQENEIRNKTEEIQRLLKKTENFNAQAEELKAKKGEARSLSKEVDSLKAQVETLEKLAAETNEKLSLVQQQSVTATVQKDLDVAELHAAASEADNKIAQQDRRIWDLESYVEDLESDVADLESEVEKLKGTVKGLEMDLQTEKKENTVQREALAGDKKAMGAIRLRAVLDRMKLDLCRIAGIKNRNPEKYASAFDSHVADFQAQGITISYHQACIDVYCKAKLKVNAAKPSDKDLLAYTSLFETEHFHYCFELIFCNSSELRTITNIKAHELPSFTCDLNELLSDSCPKKERDIVKVCLDAMIAYRPLDQRTKAQDLEEAEFKAKRDAANWKPDGLMQKLVDWLSELKKAPNPFNFFLSPTTAAAANHKNKKKAKKGTKV